jgi:hypothetical protein
MNTLTKSSITPSRIKLKFITKKYDQPNVRVEMEIESDATPTNQRKDLIETIKISPASSHSSPKSHKQSQNFFANCNKKKG